MSNMKDALSSTYRGKTPNDKLIAYLNSGKRFEGRIVEPEAIQPKKVYQNSVDIHYQYLNYLKENNMQAGFKIFNTYLLKQTQKQSKMETEEITGFNKYTQIIPTSKEVADYFIQNGFNHEQAMFWFNKMDSKGWKDSSGKKINSWTKIAWLKIQDLKKENPFNIIKQKKNACLLVSEALGQQYKLQTNKDATAYIKLIYPLVIDLKERLKITNDILLGKEIDDRFKECENWDLVNVISILNK